MVVHNQIVGLVNDIPMKSQVLLITNQHVIGFVEDIPTKSHEKYWVNILQKKIPPKIQVVNNPRTNHQPTGVSRSLAAHETPGFSDRELHDHVPAGCLMAICAAAAASCCVSPERLDGEDRNAWRFKGTQLRTSHERV